MAGAKFRFRGADWWVRYVCRFPAGTGKVFGLTVWKRNSGSPHLGGVIYVERGLAGKVRLDTEIHEALHACLPDYDEEAITGIASELTEFLWTTGYRLQDEAARFH